MARLIPSEFDAASLQGDLHLPELHTLARLRDGLSDRYVVYHGVHWARSSRAGSVYGEVDFIIANPFGRLLAIEQKNTQVVAAEGDLLAVYSAARGSARGAAGASRKSITTQINRKRPTMAVVDGAYSV